MISIIHILNQNGFDVMRGKVGSPDTNNSLDAAQCPKKYQTLQILFASPLLYVSRLLRTHVTTV